MIVRAPVPDGVALPDSLQAQNVQVHALEPARF